MYTIKRLLVPCSILICTFWFYLLQSTSYLFDLTLPLTGSHLLNTLWGTLAAGGIISFVAYLISNLGLKKQRPFLLIYLLTVVMIVTVIVACNKDEIPTWLTGTLMVFGITMTILSWRTPCNP